jgi:hypothetical protein
MATDTLRAFITAVESIIRNEVKRDKSFDVHITCETRGENRLRVLTVSVGGRRHFTVPQEECERD